MTPKKTFNTPPVSPTLVLTQEDGERLALTKINHQKFTEREAARLADLRKSGDYADLEDFCHADA